MNSHIKIAILICTYNGERFIRRQLDSIISQQHNNWTIYVSDDGSSDGTLDILNEYQNKLSSDKFIIVKGPGKGFAWNFLSLLDVCGDNFDYYAFSDQDDEWMENKLSRSLSSLSELDVDIPALYCGRTMLVNENDECIGYSPLFTKKPSFKNALIQSIAGGNTMMFNKSAREIILNTPKWKDIVSHDWWIYILISGCNGVIFYDETPMIKYRQHTNNLIGSNIGWRARLQRINGLLDGHFKVWVQNNLNALTVMQLPLSKQNRWVLDNFIAARNFGFFMRLRMFSKIRLYRQTLFGTLAFIIAVILNKI